MVTVTSSGPVAARSVTVVRAGPVSEASFWAFRLAATAAPSQGALLWKTRLGRMVIVHTV